MAKTDTDDRYDVWNWHGIINDIATLNDEGYITSERASKAVRDVVLYALGLTPKQLKKVVEQLTDMRLFHADEPGLAKSFGKLAAALAELEDAKSLTNKQLKQAQEY